jgi:hypothetical protein
MRRANAAEKNKARRCAAELVISLNCPAGERGGADEKIIAQRA